MIVEAPWRLLEDTVDAAMRGEVPTPMDTLRLTAWVRSQQADIDRLREALRPFAALAMPGDEGARDRERTVVVTNRMLLDALAAITGSFRDG